MTVQDMKQFLDQVHPNAEFKVDTQKKPVELRDVAVSLVEHADAPTGRVVLVKVV